MINVQIKKRLRSSSSKALINAVLAAIIGLGASLAQAENNWTGGFAGIDFGVGFDLGDTGELEFRRVDGSNNTAAINTAFGQNFDGEFEEGETIGLRAGYN